MTAIKWPMSASLLHYASVRTQRTTPISYHRTRAFDNRLDLRSGLANVPDWNPQTPPDPIPIDRKLPRKDFHRTGSVADRNPLTQR
jgi:hypothetical protein